MIYKSRFRESGKILIHVIEDYNLKMRGIFYYNGMLQIYRNRRIAGELRSAIRNDMYNLLSIPNQDYFFRATDNLNEPNIINKIISKNARDNYLEDGVSVSEHPDYKDFFDYKYMYVVTGKIISYGSDGEPVLDNTSIKVLAGIGEEKKYLSKYKQDMRKQEQKILKLFKISKSELEDLQSGNFELDIKI